MRGGGGGAGPAFGPAPFLLGGVGAAKGLLPCFLVPKRNQPTACTLALWLLKFGPTEGGAGYGRCPVQVGGGDPQDPLRVPAGRDDGEEHGGARALLPEDLPPVVGTPGPG